MPTDRLNIRLPKQDQRHLRALMAATGKTKSEIVREALARYYEHEGLGPTCYDVAKAAGFLGCATGGPNDLSINPKHMRLMGR
jgi:hypothetical protein